VLRKKIVIIGAGPTGLGAAHRMREIGDFDFVVLEASDHAGGLASSFRDTAGFTWDLGSHIQHSHYQKYDSYLDLALASAEWIEHDRSTWIWLLDRFVPYPFQMNLHHLPKEEKWRCVAGLLEASRRQGGDAGNFEEWMVHTFGRGIVDLFMGPYNQKIWACPPSQMNHEWVGDRVATPRLDDVLKSVCLEQDSTDWGPNAQFRYPKRGGAGIVWRRLAQLLPDGAVRFQQRVVAIDRDRRTIRCESGAKYEYDFLVSTLPLDYLAEICTPSADLAGAKSLKKTETHVVGIGLAGETPKEFLERCWGYYPQEDLPFHRLTVMSNLSPENTPNPGRSWSLLAEVSESENARRTGDIVEQTVQGMIRIGAISDPDAILSRWHSHLPRGYPAPSLDRDRLLATLLPLLENEGIFSRGRFGAWKYEVSNQDHSFMQGVEVIDRIVSGQPELTLHCPNLVNGRYNPFPFPEWEPGQPNEQ